MWRLAFVLALSGSMMLAAACGGGDKAPDGDNTPSAAKSATPKPATDDGDLRSHEADLREAAVAFETGIFTDGAVKSYSYFADDFKERCSLEDFIALLAIVKIFLGDLEDEDVAVEVTGVRYEDGKAFVDTTGTINGDSIDEGDDDEEFPDYWVREDGEWKITTDEPEPCDSDSAFSDDSDDETPAATGPGTSRAEAVPIGTSVRTGDAEVTVLNVDLDAEALIAAASDFPATPEPGNLFVLVNLRVEAVGSGEETIDIDQVNFSMTGSGNTVYESFGEDTSCGFDVPDELDVTLFPGGSAEGNICIQIPQHESGLILIYEPQFTFDNEDRRYLSLE